MFRTVLLCGLVASALATPLAVRSKDQVEQYRKFLRGTKTNQQNILAAKDASIQHPEMYSGKFEGDIILDDDVIEDMVSQYASGRNAIINPNLATSWPDGVVKWKFADGHMQDPELRARVLAAIQDIEDHTCVKFREVLPTDFAFVDVTNHYDGCWAHVGFNVFRGAHQLNLGALPGADCFNHATIVHEWMHILGFYHMHTTAERDDYIRINTENITPGAESYFNKFDWSTVNSMGVEYDYLSCLHYPALAFSSNWQPTIEATRQHEGVMGQRDFVTESDWLRINRLYHCPGAFD